MGRVRHTGRKGGLALLVGSLAAGATGKPPVDTVAQERVQAIARANGEQFGTIRACHDGTLSLVPYNATSDLKELRLPSNIVVFRGDALAASSILEPGVGVCVHFLYEPHGAAQVTAIEVLSPHQIRTARMLALRTAPVMRAPATADGLGEAQLLAHATGFATGQIDELGGEYLILRGSGRNAGELKLQADQGSAPVYAGHRRVAWGTLKPGIHVHVYFRSDGSSATPHVVAVEVLK